jgi:hypothetical protein
VLGNITWGKSMQRSLISAFAVAVLASTLMAAPAYAETVPPTTTTTTPDGVTTTLSYSEADPDICDAMREAGATSCIIEDTLKVYAPTDGSTTGPTPMGGELQSTSTGTVRCRTYDVARRPRDGSKLWQVSHSGKFCYDGTYAWTGTYRNNAGFHTCGNRDYGFGFGISRVNCSTSGSKTSQVRHVYTAKVSFVARGVPLSQNYTLEMRGSRSGTITHYGL